MSDYQLEDTIFLPFTTRQFSDGVPTVLAGTPAIDIYEDATATPIITGETLAVSLNGVVGFNMITVTATSGSGFNVGGFYTAVIQAGTVGGVSVVGEVVATFSIDASAAAVDLANGTDGLTALKTGIDDIPTVSEFNARTIVSANYFDPAADTVVNVTNVATLTGHTAQTGDGFARLATYRLGELMSEALASQPFATSLLGDLTQDDPDNAGTQQFTVAALARAWDEVLSGALHNITNSSGRRLRQLQEAGGYIGSIWIDTVDGVAGTTDFENGTDTKPSLTIGDANTLASSLNIERFEVAPGSSITFLAAQENQSFTGDGWTLVLGSQSVAGSTFRGADVSGTGTGEPHEFHDCHFGVTTLGGGEFKNCGLEDTITLSAAVMYSFIDCYHNESGAASTIDFDAGGVTEVHIHNWHGNLTILNMGAGDILHFSSSNGNLTMDVSCTGGTRNSAGTFGLTDNSSGMAVNDLGQMYQRIGAPVGADLSADIAAIPTTAMRGTDSAALASVCTEARLSELDESTGGKMANQVDIIQVDTTTDIPALIAALNDISVSDVLTTQMTEAYAADGVAPTLAQALFMIQQFLGDFGIVSTTYTVRKIDGSTTAATFTLDNGTAPTDITRAS